MVKSKIGGVLKSSRKQLASGSRHGSSPRLEEMVSGKKPKAGIRFSPSTFGRELPSGTSPIKLDKNRSPRASKLSGKKNEDFTSVKVPLRKATLNAGLKENIVNQSEAIARKKPNLPKVNFKNLQEKVSPKPSPQLGQIGRGGKKQQTSPPKKHNKKPDTELKFEQAKALGLIKDPIKPKVK